MQVPSLTLTALGLVQGLLPVPTFSASVKSSVGECRDLVGFACDYRVPNKLRRFDTYISPTQNIPVLQPIPRGSYKYSNPAAAHPVHVSGVPRPR